MDTLTKIYTKDLTNDSIWIVNTPRDPAKSFLLYVQELGLFKARAKYSTYQENIASYLVMLTLAGQGELVDKNHGSYTLTPGKLVFIDSMEPHTHFTYRGVDDYWEILWVQFNGVSARGYYSQFAAKDSPVLDTSSSPKIQSLLEDLVEINKTKSAGVEFLSNKILVELLTEILFAAGTVLSPQVGAPGFVQDAISDIDAHFSADLSLEYFSKKLMVSKYHFAKEFKKYTGFSPVEYLIDTRINNAKQLLQFSDMAISEISDSVGFNNTCHFINMFKQRVGITPLKFKKQYQLAPRRIN